MEDQPEWLTQAESCSSQLSIFNSSRREDEQDKFFQDLFDTKEYFSDLDRLRRMSNEPISRCSHCGAKRMQPHFMEHIIVLRELLGFPFVVTSAYRCPDHPIEAAKEAPGAHTTGMAIDIQVYGNNAHRLLDAALRAGFSGIGISQKGDHSTRFIHLDKIGSLEGRPRPTVWSY